MACVLMSDARPVLFDTDIGSDIDDAICLAYLLAQPRCELLGVTTVTGQPDVRAALVDAVCRAAGRTDIPIHAGAEPALRSTITPQPNVPQAEALDRFEHLGPDRFEPSTAVAFMHETIVSRPGEVTLLAVGPLTNVAMLFAAYPHAAAALRALVIMGGRFAAGRSVAEPCEWNVWCDPHAARDVYATAVPDHVSVGLDVTMRCAMDAGAAIARFESVGGPWPVVSAMSDLWRQSRHSIVFHDPLAAASIFRPEVCRWTRGRVTVNIAAERNGAATMFEPDSEGPHTVATDVDLDVFFPELLGVTPPPISPSTAELSMREQEPRQPPTRACPGGDGLPNLGLDHTENRLSSSEPQRP